MISGRYEVGTEPTIAVDATALLLGEYGGNVLLAVSASGFR
jgi:hypothetical protein